MVVCPNCRHESSGRFFCDRCHSLLSVSELAPLPGSLTLADGRAVDMSPFNGRFPPEYWRPVASTCGDAPCRLYALGPSWWPEQADRFQRRQRLTLDVLAPLDIVSVGEGAVVVAAALPAADCPLA